MNPYTDAMAGLLNDADERGDHDELIRAAVTLLTYVTLWRGELPPEELADEVIEYYVKQVGGQLYVAEHREELH